MRTSPFWPLLLALATTATGCTDDGSDAEGPLAQATSEVEVATPAAAWPSLGGGAARGGRSLFLAPAAPTVRWTATGYGGFTSAPAVDGFGRIYVGSRDNHLRVFGPDGALLWSFQTGGAVNGSPTLGPDGTVYVGSWDGKLYALREGALRWSFQTGSFVLGAPALAPDGTLYVGSYDGSLYALDSATGAELWHHAFGRPLRSSPALTADGGVCIGSGDPFHLGGGLHCLAATGSLRFSHTFDQSYATSTPAIGRDGTIYIGSGAGKLYAYAADGTSRWVFDDGGSMAGIWYASPALSADGTVYIAASDGTLYAVGSDGQQRWKRKTSGALRSTPLVDGAGRIHVVTAVGTVTAILPDGTIAWSQAAGALADLDASAALGPDGTLYAAVGIGASDGRLIALGGGGATGEPAIQSGDGMVLAYDRTAHRFTHLAFPGLAASFSAARSLGVEVYQPVAGGDSLLLDPAATPPDASFVDGAWLLRRSAGSLTVTETWRAEPHALSLVVELSHQGPATTLPVKACLRLPLDLVDLAGLTGDGASGSAAPARWFPHLHAQASQPITGGATLRTAIAAPADIGVSASDAVHLDGAALASTPLNLHSLNHVGNDRFGLAIAADPAYPAAFATEYRGADRALQTCFYVTLNRAHQIRGGTERVGLRLLFADEPAWGMRSSFAKLVASDPVRFPPSMPGGLIADVSIPAGAPTDSELHLWSIWNAYRSSLHPTAHGLAYLWPTGHLERSAWLEEAPGTGTCTAPAQPAADDIALCLGMYAAHEATPVGGPFEKIQCADSNFIGGCVDDTAGDPALGHVCEASKPIEISARRVSSTNVHLMPMSRLPVHDAIASSLLRDGPDSYRSLLYATAHFPIYNHPTRRTCYFNALDPDPGAGYVASVPAPGATPPASIPSFGALNIEMLKRTAGLYGADYLHQGHAADGAALDTVGSYLRYDRNPDKLDTASFPAAYARPDPAGAPVPVLLEHLTSHALVRAVRASLPSGMPVLINGLPISGLFAEYLDGFLVETIPSDTTAAGTVAPLVGMTDLATCNGAGLAPGTGSNVCRTALRSLYRFRLAGYRRPVTQAAAFSSATDEASLLEQLQRFLPPRTALGIFVLPTDRDDGRQAFLDHLTDLDRAATRAPYLWHLDVVARLTSLGWEPVTRARAFDGTTEAPDILVERFGDQTWTLLNTSDTTRTITFSIGTGTIESFDYAANAPRIEPLGPSITIPPRQVVVVSH